MSNTVQLQWKIQDIIDKILENWCNEKYRITIESFRREKNCLVLFRIGNWGEKYHFFKSAILVRPNKGKSFKRFEKFVSFIENFSHERT